MCLSDSYMTMSADVYKQEILQSASNAVKRVWVDSGRDIKCSVESITSSGTRQIGSSEEWSDTYKDIQWIRMKTSEILSKRDRVVDIRNSQGIIWGGQYEIVGVNPIIGIFGEVVE
jgi:hypothetical protein